MSWNGFPLCAIGQKPGGELLSFGQSLDLHGNRVHRLLETIQTGVARLRFGLAPETAQLLAGVVQRDAHPGYERRDAEHEKYEQYFLVHGVLVRSG